MALRMFISARVCCALNIFIFSKVLTQKAEISSPPLATSAESTVNATILRSEVSSQSHEISSTPPVTSAASSFLPNHLSVTIAVFAPFNDTPDFGVKRIQPAVDLAIRTAASMVPLVNFSATYKNSKDPFTTICIESMELLFNRKADVLIGPVDDIALDEVAKIAAHLNKPILSPGGLDINFGLDKKSDMGLGYRTLIRMGASFNSLINFVIMLLLDELKFTKVKVISEKNSERYVCNQFHNTVRELQNIDYTGCNRFSTNSGYLLNMLKNKNPEKNYQFDFYLIPRNINFTHLFHEEIGVEYGGTRFVISF
ncbi:hypothetical protein DPMN_023113 [Dreissena polymorpha]|uniref:Receptor ligand binding region domain-containing protein n=1 Tax=Dreissena polymorpha TaxID=45954 RepID=A0A9D4R9M2_DREPO|nr:hypothetical protein DPMN_023113 [Dreissena polymorpha]